MRHRRAVNTLARGWLPLVALLTLLGGCVTGEERDSYRQLPWPTARQEEPLVKILDNQTEYEELFHESFAKYRQPAPHPPDVNFLTHHVVGIFWGMKPTTGYDIALEAVELGPESVHVTIRTIVPDGPVGQALTYPAIALALPQDRRIHLHVTGDRPGERISDFTAVKTAEYQINIER